MSITDETVEDLRKEKLYVLILATIQFVHILDFVIMMPLGPNFMRVFDITTTQFSALVSAYTFSAGIVGFIGALYADHFDRKRFLLFNFTGFIIGTAMCAMAQGFASLLIARIIAGAFGGVLNACVLSLIAELIPFKRRGTAMGVVMSAFSVSSVVGIPIGLYLANLFDWHAAFIFICILAAFFWVAAVIILPPVKVDHEPTTLVQNLKNFQKILAQPDYLISFSLTVILAFGVFGIVPFISPYMVKNVGLTERDLPLIYLIGGTCSIISSRIIGRACDRHGSFKVFRFLAIVSIVPMLLITNAPALPIWGGLIITSLFMVFVSGRFIPAMTLISGVVKPKERGTFMSLENSFRQLAAGASSQIAGILITTGVTGELVGYNRVGYIGIMTSVVAIFIALKVTKKVITTK